MRRMSARQAISACPASRPHFQKLGRGSHASLLQRPGGASESNKRELQQPGRHGSGNSTREGHAARTSDRVRAPASCVFRRDLSDISLWSSRFPGGRSSFSGQTGTEQRLLVCPARPPPRPGCPQTRGPVRLREAAHGTPRLCLASTVSGTATVSSTFCHSLPRTGIYGEGA